MKEFVIWGKNKDNNLEIPLYTKAKSIKEAEAVLLKLEKDFDCFDCRIQIIDFTKSFDFSKEIF